MRETTRRRVLATSGGSVAALLVGCSGGGGGDGGTGDVSLSVPTPQGDANVTPTLRVTLQDAPLESLVVDIEKVVFVAEEGEDVGFAVGETGVGLTGIAGQGQGAGLSVAEGHPFPTRPFATAAVYMPIRSASTTDGGSPSFPSAAPLEVDLVVFDPMRIDAGATGSVTLGGRPREPFGDGGDWQLGTSYAMVGG
jgi:hypothetical protein